MQLLVLTTIGIPDSDLPPTFSAYIELVAARLAISLSIAMQSFGTKPAYNNQQNTSGQVKETNVAEGNLRPRLPKIGPLLQMFLCGSQAHD